MEILLATGLITLLSLLGVLFFGNQGHLTGTHRYIVPFAIGTFLGVAFFELIPEALAGGETLGGFAIVSGFLSFYVLAHFLDTYHHHHHDGEEDDHCDANKSSAVLLLVGDAVHNFVDGIVIASAFIVNPVAGWVTTFGIALHEAPQEIAEYAVLRHAGYSRRDAALYNLGSASTVIFGAAAVLLTTSLFSSALYILIGLAAGNLLYVAMSDLIPDVQEATRAHGKFLPVLISTLIGFGVITSIISWSHDRFGEAPLDAHESALTPER